MVKGRWFRLYDDLINDPKILALAVDLRWPWIALLCLASKHEGRLPDMGHIALALRVSKQRAAGIVARLHRASLLDVEGDGLRPHNWDGRQHKVDSEDPTAALRMRKYRSKIKDGVTAVTRNAGVTALRPESEAESESDSEPVGLCGVDRPTNEPASGNDEEGEGDLRAEIAKLFAAAGRPSVDTAHAAVWLAQGFDARLVRAVIAGRMSRAGTITTLRFFDAAIRDAHAARASDTGSTGNAGTVAPRAATPAAQGAPPEMDIEKAVAFYARTQFWSRYAGPEPGLGGCRASPELLARYGLAPDGRRLPRDDRKDCNEGGEP